MLETVRSSPRSDDGPAVFGASRRWARAFPPASRFRENREITGHRPLSGGSVVRTDGASSGGSTGAASPLLTGIMLAGGTRPPNNRNDKHPTTQERRHTKTKHSDTV